MSGTMLAAYKPDEITSVPFEEARKIAVAGLKSLTGKEPDDKVTALVLAKVTLESGRKGTTLLTSCHQGNVGNIKAGEDYNGMYTLYACNEIINGVVEWFAPEGKLAGKHGPVVSELHLLPPEGFGHPQCRFRAYANVVDGLYEYLDFIWREKYRDARDALLTGNPIAYVHALKLKGYFTADETSYARGVAGLHAEFVARIAGRPAPEMDVPDLTGVVAAQPFNLRAATALVDAAFADRRYQIIEENTRVKDGFLDQEPDTAVLPKGTNQA